jgi:hypothetical protein
MEQLSTPINNNEKKWVLGWVSAIGWTKDNFHWTYMYLLICIQGVYPCMYGSACPYQQ